MDVDQIKMDPDIANVHYQRYRASVGAARAERLEEAKKNITETGRALRSARTARTKIEKEDEQLAKAYKALKQGKTLVNVQRALEGAALHNKNRLPKLAIARADWEFCHLHWGPTNTSDWTNVFTFSKTADNYGAFEHKSNRIQFPSKTFSAELSNQEWRRKHDLLRLDNQRSRPRALVPTIPPHLRPEDPIKFFILWDAVWEKSPPVDPLLLSKVNDTMYAVVAQWDLTELEQQVLEGRFT